MRLLLLSAPRGSRGCADDGKRRDSTDSLHRSLEQLSSDNVTTTHWQNSYCTCLYIAVVHVSALMWGQQHEDDALEAYKRTLPSHLSLHGAGFFVSSCGFLGTSPDGIVKDKSDSVRLVEVKCPYKARERNIEEMLDDPIILL